jgi:hypothetical protein
MRLYGLLDPQREVAIIQSMARKMRIQYRHLNDTARALVPLIIVGLTVPEQRNRRYRGSVCTSTLSPDLCRCFSVNTPYHEQCAYSGQGYDTGLRNRLKPYVI